MWQNLQFGAFLKWMNALASSAITKSLKEHRIQVKCMMQKIGWMQSNFAFNQVTVEASLLHQCANHSKSTLPGNIWKTLHTSKNCTRRETSVCPFTCQICKMLNMMEPLLQYCHKWLPVDFRTADRNSRMNCDIYRDILGVQCSL